MGLGQAGRRSGALSSGPADVGSGSRAGGRLERQRKLSGRQKELVEFVATDPGREIGNR